MGIFQIHKIYIQREKGGERGMGIEFPAKCQNVIHHRDIIKVNILIL